MNYTCPPDTWLNIYIFTSLQRYHQESLLLILTVLPCWPWWSSIKALLDCFFVSTLMSIYTLSKSTMPIRLHLNWSISDCHHLHRDICREPSFPQPPPFFFQDFLTWHASLLILSHHFTVLFTHTSSIVWAFQCNSRIPTNHHHYTHSRCKPWTSVDKPTYSYLTYSHLESFFSKSLCKENFNLYKVQD